MTGPFNKRRIRVGKVGYLIANRRKCRKKGSAIDLKDVIQLEVLS